MNEFMLPSLPYAEDALAPVMSAETIAYHYGKHHRTYVTNLNKLIAGTPLEDKPMKYLLMKPRGPCLTTPLRFTTTITSGSA